MSSPSILFHIGILRGYPFTIQAFKSKMCFEQQKSTRDPRVWCSTRIKTCTKRQNIVTSHSKMLVTASRSLAVQQPPKRDEIGSSYNRRLYHVPLQKIFSSLRMARAIRSNTIANFSNSSSQPSKKKKKYKTLFL